MLVGVLFAGMMFVFVDLNGNEQITRMAAVAVLMSIFWVTEAIPLAATALLPLVLFPVLGIASSKDVASQYINSTVFLFVGGFMIALAMERWQLHKRIALNILALCGTSPALLVMGFMLATAGLSMWISNTATALVMLPIALAIISRYEQTLSIEQAHRFSVGLLLSIAYSASVGGMLTLVGTAPNLVFARFYEIATGTTISFAQWMLIALPVGILILVLLAIVLAGIYLRNLPGSKRLKQLIMDEKRQLGRISTEEISVLIVFLLTAVLWITRKGLIIGDLVIIGWSGLFEYGGLIDDGSVAIAMASLLFFIPVRQQADGQVRLLDEKVFLQLPWAVIILFGGGFALAYGFSESGLSAYVASQLSALQTASPELIIFAVTAVMSALTELTSNTATTQLVMPILISAAKVMNLPAVWLMLPATLAASCAFMFPVATPPNAIIFSSGRIKIWEMLRIGIILNIIAVLLITLFTSVLIKTVF